MRQYVTDQRTGGISEGMGQFAQGMAVFGGEALEGLERRGVFDKGQFETLLRGYEGVADELGASRMEGAAAENERFIDKMIQQANNNPNPELRAEALRNIEQMRGENIEYRTGAHYAREYENKLRQTLSAPEEKIWGMGINRRWLAEMQHNPYFRNVSADPYYRQWAMLVGPGVQ